MFQLRGVNQRNAGWTCGRGVQSVDAVVADGFALTGGCKVVRASLLCGESSVALLLESPLLDATVAIDSLA